MEAPFKILLINPDINKSHSRISSFFPSGLAYLASSLEQNSFDVRIIDFQNSPGIKLHDELKSYNPGIVGIGCLFSHYLPNAKEIARQIKKLNPNIIIALGGLHPTIFYNEIIGQINEIDYIILGEGEISFSRLCDKIRNRADNFEDIDGLAYRYNGGIRVNPKTEFIDNLDTLPFPSFDKIDMEKYYYHLRYNKNNRGMSLVTSRSCPNRCTFCSMFHSHGSKWRQRTPENIIEEIGFLYKKYNIRNFQFMDDNMSFDKDRTIRIFKSVIQSGMKITFFFPNGIAIKTLDREVLKIMKEAGCLEIRLPIESGSEFLRNRVMKKRLSNEKIFDVIEICNEFEIPTIGYYILGMPGEDHETMQENINFVKQLRGRRFIDFLGINFAVPYPGTALFKQCIGEGLVDDSDVEKLMDGSLTIFDQPIIKLKTLTKNELINYRKELLRILFRQNVFKIIARYAKPTRNNYQIFRAIFHRFVVGY